MPYAFCRIGVSQRPLKLRSFRTQKNNYMSVCELGQKNFSCKIRNSDVDYSHKYLRPGPGFPDRSPFHEIFQCPTRAQLKDY